MENLLLDIIRTSPGISRSGITVHVNAELADLEARGLIARQEVAAVLSTGGSYVFAGYVATGATDLDDRATRVLNGVKGRCAAILESTASWLSIVGIRDLMAEPRPRYSVINRALLDLAWDERVLRDPPLSAGKPASGMSVRWHWVTPIEGRNAD